MKSSLRTRRDVSVLGHLTVKVTMAVMTEDDADQRRETRWSATRRPMQSAHIGDAGLALIHTQEQPPLGCRTVTSGAGGQ